jgi:outer membrane protein assembly factor BamE
MRHLLALLAAVCLTACGFVGFPGVYRIDVEQGNIVTPELVAQLKPGMSQRQVRFILGTPLLQDPFNQERWDYPYVKRNGLKVLSESKMSVYFDGDTLVRYVEEVEEGRPDSGQIKAEDDPPQDAATSPNG